MEYHKKISFFGKSDMGRVRTNNEDAFVAQTLWDDDTILAAAIDGVGGYEGGEVAADIARKTIPEFLQVSPNGERLELLKQAVTAANNAIYEARQEEGGFPYMSCVLTAAIIDVAQRQISMAHVGDSRLYSFREGELKKLSHDHSLVGYREEIGDLTEEQAMHHPQRNLINRDVGSENHKVNDDDFIEADVFPLLPNTTLLFCSDGLTDLVTSAKIREILGQDTTLNEKTDALIAAANAEGGKDNITVVLVEYQSDEPVDTIEPKTVEQNTAEAATMPEETAITQPKRRKTIVPIVLAAMVLLGVGGYFGFKGRNSANKQTVEPVIDQPQSKPNCCDCPNCPFRQVNSDSIPEQNIDN